MNKPTSQKDPRMDWGFYAMTPRIVRTKYKELSHTEKWLYTCLKDLCGKKGTCFRTLRSLKEETDISIASLSTMIPRLHEAGLIHAEKKRSPRSGKEIWHISIVDIWQMNKDYCSEIEQSQNAVVQNLNEDLEVVHSVNKVVQKTNKETEDCSNSERGCSNFSDIRIYPENIDTEIDSEEEGTYSEHDHDADTGAIAPTRALVSHPEYGFLWFDDPLAPSLMVVRLTPEYPHPYHSPDEDKRRERIAGWEVEPYLKARGLNVSVIFMHDLGNETTVEASPAHSHIATDTPTHKEDTDGLPTSELDCAESALRAGSEHRRAPSQAVADEDTVKRPAVRVPAQQLSTIVPQSGKVSHARVAPARPAQSGRKKKGVEYTVYFSTEGAAFRAWYEELTGVKIDETAANARACNSLASRASVTYDNLKLVVREIRTSKWVKREHVGVTVQDLASDDRMLRWEKWLTGAQMAAQSEHPKPVQDAVSPPINEQSFFASLLAERPLPPAKGVIA